MRKKKVLSFGKHSLKMQNDNVISTVRKTGLFATNEQVIDAALRLLVFKLKEEFERVPKTEVADAFEDAKASLDLPVITEAPTEEPSGNPGEGTP